MGVQQPPVPATNLTLISRLSFCAGEAGENAPLVVCAQNGRILLANSKVSKSVSPTWGVALSQRHRVK
jgi:hypothetical protein